MTDKKEKCVIDGCKRAVSVQKHKLCKAHANRFYWFGDPGSGKIMTRKRHAPYKKDETVSSDT